MKKWLILLAITVFFAAGCCTPGDNACYKYWYGLEPHPTEPGKYINRWDKLYNPELRDENDPGSWDWLFMPDYKKSEK